MSWWRRHWRWMLALLLSGLTAIVVLVLLLVRKTRQAEDLKTKLQLQQTAAKVKGLEADKKARQYELVANRTKAREIEDEIVAAKKATVAVVKEVEKMDDLQILDEFKKLGY
jgi:hypothetical protein